MRAGSLRLPAVILFSALWAASGCSMATKVIANTLAKPGTTYTGDDDPELVRRALPFGLKTYESVLESRPTHLPLLLATCSGFTGYSYGFVETDAVILGDAAEHNDEVKALRKEALLLYVRARDYCLRGMDVRFKGISERLYKDPANAFAKVDVKKDDIPLLYWTAASWGSAISLGLDRIDLIGDFPAVRALVDKAVAVDPDWNKGSLHELLMTLDALPESIGGAPAAKRPALLKQHFDRAVELQKGLSPGPYVSLASNIDVSEKSAAELDKLREEYTKLLEQALAIDPNKDKSNRLVTILTQRRAKAMLEQIDTKIPRLPEE
jgi:hypothetical protein